ncbi:MAG: hypothetical protein ACKV2T_05310 [Kofleriaceae bacterium]
MGAAKVDNRSAVVGFYTETGWTVQFLGAPVGKPVTATATYAIPSCSP